MSAYAVSSRGLAAHKVPQGVLATIMEMLYSNSEKGIAKLDFSDFTGMYQDRARTIPYTAVEQPLGSFTGLNGVTATAPADVNRGVVSARVNLFTESEVRHGLSDISVYGGAITATTLPGYLGGLSLQQNNVDGSYAYQPIYCPVGEYTYSVVLKMDDGLPPEPSVDFILVFFGGEYATTIEDVGGGLYRVSSSMSGSQFNVYCGITKLSSSSARGFKVTAFDLRLTADAHLPYQRVNTATDYDTAGFPHYLTFNGINTAYVTPSIDFTGTDKMTVWAGVTKLSDAAVALIAEFGAGLPSGGFYVAAPNSVGPTFGFASKGTVQATSTPLGHAAPKNAVLTGIGDISGDIASIRVNGVATTANTDQGTGNYGNLPLYIGARAGTSIFFNGRLYSLIARGAQSSLSQIEATEAYIKQKMRLP